MAEGGAASPEVVYVARAEAAGAMDRVKQGIVDFVKSQAPREHQKRFMKQYDWVGGHLEGTSKDLFDRFRPTADKIAMAEGIWVTSAEIAVAVAAAGGAVYFLGPKAKDAVFNTESRRKAWDGTKALASRVGGRVGKIVGGTYGKIEGEVTKKVGEVVGLAGATAIGAEVARRLGIKVPQKEAGVGATEAKQADAWAKAMPILEGLPQKVPLRTVEGRANDYRVLVLSDSSGDRVIAMSTVKDSIRNEDIRINFIDKKGGKIVATDIYKDDDGKLQKGSRTLLFDDPAKTRVLVDTFLDDGRPEDIIAGEIRGQIVKTTGEDALAIATILQSGDISPHDRLTAAWLSHLQTRANRPTG